MYNIKEFKISNLINDTSFYINKMLDLEADWLDQIAFTSNTQLSQQYADICRQHHQEHKWVLMINPEEDSLEKLTENHGIDAGKILRVNTNQQSININHIEIALQKGNCAAVVVSNTDFNQEQIAQLSKSAQRGKTQCVVINKKALH